MKTKDITSIKDYIKEHTNKKRPDICTTEKQIRNHRDITRKKVVPGNRSYASSTQYGKKVFVVGDSHLKRINRRKFDYSLSNAKSYIKSFPGAKVEELEHYVIPHLQYQKPDATIMHIGGNNINYKDLDAIDVSSTENNVDFLVKIRKSHHENPFVGYLNINSLRNKIISLREILLKAPIDILCTDETKLDDSFPDAQFLIENSHFPPFRKDRNSNGGGKMVFIRKELIAK